MTIACSRMPFTSPGADTTAVLVFRELLLPDGGDPRPSTPFSSSAILYCRDKFAGTHTHTHEATSK